VLLDGGGAAAGLRVERTALAPAPGGGQRAAGTGEYEEIEAQLVLESIGYRGLPLGGAAFDPAAAVVPNRLGQALLSAAPGAAPDPGLFVCGWLKRGPTGIIGTNLVDAEQTVDTMVRARASFPAVKAGGGGGQGLRALLLGRGVQVVGAAGWEAIDAEEVARGAAAGKPREKLTCVEEMLGIAAAADAAAAAA
jgi:adrenodoxin-NADP+ reductase